MEERTELETVHLVDSHYRRSFGRSPDKEMRDFIKNAVSNGLTAAELLTCMVAVRLAYVFNASEAVYRKAFMAGTRNLWRAKNGKEIASP